MENNLKNESSPYLLQHKNNPVHWFPWCQEAFDKAENENKPIFLSIGYSTCHWCHVMAHESFEEKEVADILNEKFVSIKVDKEERPDIDSVYMSVCLAFTGGGGWPMSIFMTPSQQPFYAGTYFTKGMFINLLTQIHTLWKTQQNKLISSGEEVIHHLGQSLKAENGNKEDLIDQAVEQFKKTFDCINGGFGSAPKFPVPHNLLFLMDYSVMENNKEALDMAEKTLLQMYKGGMFDHIGFGFSRYATDECFLIPHFEKMLYDNALLIMSYIKAYTITNKNLYKEIAVKTAEYIMREMTNSEGGFFSAQDADSDGVEGKYYVFDASELRDLLGEAISKEFNAYYGVTKQGNFEGKNILNLLHHNDFDKEYEKYFKRIYEYRKARANLHLDNKILTSWNGLMITAFAMMYHVLENEIYLDIARKACDFIDKNLSDKEFLYVSYRDGKCAGKGFLDDYAFYIFALITMYQVTSEETYLDHAVFLCNRTIEEFYDTKNSGFFFYGKHNETLILRPKETYDGAIPSGNSVMTYNLLQLSKITDDKTIKEMAENQMEFMASEVKNYPMGNSFYLLALDIYRTPTVYVCKEDICMSPSNTLDLVRR